MNGSNNKIMRHVLVFTTCLIEQSTRKWIVNRMQEFPYILELFLNKSTYETPSEFPKP